VSWVDRGCSKVKVASRVNETCEPWQVRTLIASIIVTSRRILAVRSVSTRWRHWSHQQRRINAHCIRWISIKRCNCAQLLQLRSHTARPQVSCGCCCCCTVLQCIRWTVSSREWNQRSTDARHGFHAVTAMCHRPVCITLFTRQAFASENFSYLTKYHIFLHASSSSSAAAASLYDCSEA